MKKVLFTIQWYGIPSSIAASANALCDEYIINELKKVSDIEVHTLSYNVSGFPQEEILDGVHVHRFKRSKFWNNYILTRNGEKSLKRNFYYYGNRILMRIKQLVFFYKFPNYEPMHTKKFQKEALKLHRIYNFDIVISEFNGIDSVNAGVAIKRLNPEVKFLPICWDSIGGGRIAKWMPTNICRNLRMKAESKIMRFADISIVMRSSEKFHMTNLLNNGYRNKFVFLDVPYFKKNNSVVDISPCHKGYLAFLYSGTMCDRDPRILLAALDKLKIPIIFTFICSTPFHDTILKLQEALSNVELKCLPYMSHEELVKYQMESDVLVNFGVLNTNAVSGKIFDYMGKGKPIISTIAVDNEACIPYLKKYPKALIFDERRKQSSNIIELGNFIQKMQNIDVDMEKMENVFYENTPMAYIQVINKLLKE